MWNIIIISYLVFCFIVATWYTIAYLKAFNLVFKERSNVTRDFKILVSILSFVITFVIAPYNLYLLIKNKGKVSLSMDDFRVKK